MLTGTMQFEITHTTVYCMHGHMYFRRVPEVDVLASNRAVGQTDDSNTPVICSQCCTPTDRAYTDSVGMAHSLGQRVH